MRNITKIFTLVLSLILLFAVSCSNDDKTGVKNNPPENDTEITDGETGGTGSSEEGEGEPETPPTPSETETTETIDAEYFPTELLGAYRDDILYSMYGPDDCSKVSYDEITKETKIEGPWRKDGTNPPKGQMKTFLTKKWKQTKKGGKIIKLESELVSEWFGGKFTVTYDYETETLSCTFTKNNGEKYLFSGKK